MSLGRTESGKTGVSTGLSPFPLLSPAWSHGRGVSRDQREKRRKREACLGRGERERSWGARKGEVGQWPVNHRHRRNDAALLSKIASQEKLRAKLPPLRLVPHPLMRPPSPRLPVDSLCWNRYDGSRNPEGFTLKYCGK